MDRMATALIDVVGISGTNGKLGELRRTVERMEKTMGKFESTIEDFKAFKWKVIGAICAAVFVANLAVALLTKIL